MLILPQFIIKIWNFNNKKYYESKGYKYTNIGDTFKVDILDLKIGSHDIIKCTCDYCNNEINKEYRDAINTIINKKKICCAKCQPLKNKDTLIEKHGIINISQLSETKNKVKYTNLKRYGVVNISQSEEIKNKKEVTCLKNYGVKNGFQLRDKIEQTCLERYGETNPFKSKQFVDELRKNGYTFGFENPETQKKIIINSHKTMYKNGKAPCTRPQKYIYELLNSIQKCELNYPVDRLWLDIAYPEEMIYIEYDGGGHNKRVKCNWQTQEEFNKKEIDRQYYLKNKGWKIIRIISSNDKLPLDERIIELINECKNYLLNSNHNWIRIDLNENKIICKEYEKNIN